MYSGYGFGIMMVALVAIPVIPHWGWRGLFWLGAIPLVMAPFLWRALPRSFEQLARSGKHAEAVDAGVAFGAASETAEWLAAHARDPSSTAPIQSQGGIAALFAEDRKSVVEGKRVSVTVDPCGRRSSKKKQKKST